MKTVYLCGGINGLNDTDCKDWRAEATAALLPLGFAVLDPMRRDFRGQEAVNTDAIVYGDLFDIKASQFILVNAARPSWGTAMEIVYARQDVEAGRKRVIAFNAPEKPSPWLVFHCDKLYPTLTEALSWFKPSFTAWLFPVGGVDFQQRFATVEEATTCVEKFDKPVTAAEIYEERRSGERNLVRSWCNR